MKKYQELATLLLRFAMALTFLSAVASRLGLWGKYSSGWEKFLGYTSEVNSFAPHCIIPFLAVSATVLEIIFSVLLIIGYKTKWTALGSAILTLIYALATSYSFGLKEPFDYSVFVDTAACFFLFTFPYFRWSLDKKIQKIKNK
jgi:putative oxidoreductase